MLDCIWPTQEVLSQSHTYYFTLPQRKKHEGKERIGPGALIKQYVHWAITNRQLLYSKKRTISQCQQDYTNLRNCRSTLNISLPLTPFFRFSYRRKEATLPDHQ